MKILKFKGMSDDGNPLDKKAGGGDNGDMETRVAKLEALSVSTDKRLGLIEQDLRTLSSKVDKYFILGLFGLIGASAAGYSLYDKVFMMNVEMNEKLLIIIEKLP